MAAVLAGIKVLEFSEVLAGPWGGRLLADLGADVVKVEPVDGEPWRHWGQVGANDSPGFLTLNWGKRGLALNLKDPAGQEVIRRLVPAMDVVLINYRPDTPARLGIDYETLSAINPRLVYVEATALGREGPSKHRPGYDIIAQAMSGLMVANAKRGPGGTLQPIGAAVADMATGTTIAWAVCAGLFARERTGEGVKIETSLLATALGLQASGLVQLEEPSGATGLYALSDQIRAARAAGATWEELMAMREGRTGSNTYYRCYRTKDSMIALGALSQPLQRRAATAMGLVDPRQTDPTLPKAGPEADRLAVALTTEAEERLAERTTSEWLGIFDAAGVPAAPVSDPADVLDDPQVVANELAMAAEHPTSGGVTMLGSLLRFGGERPRSPRSSPGLGEHDDEILAQLGYTGEEIADLKARGVTV